MNCHPTLFVTMSNLLKNNFPSDRQGLEYADLLLRFCRPRLQLHCSQKRQPSGLFTRNIFRPSDSIFQNWTVLHFFNRVGEANEVSPFSPWSPSPCCTLSLSTCCICVCLFQSSSLFSQHYHSSWVTSLQQKEATGSTKRSTWLVNHQEHISDS